VRKSVGIADECTRIAVLQHTTARVSDAEVVVRRNERYNPSLAEDAFSIFGGNMDPKIEVLDLFLRELGEDSSIEGIENRLRLQKAVYLGQLFGVDLGYRYSWYVKGPYSSPLTQDYYKLAESAADPRSGNVLRPDLAEKLGKARSL
jgi:hypothetical protein